ncbi:unnamed protein product [Phytomonas sp. Hart1]|nr:unnamed protein product [Phytomonas sp. Hart1]|eukprot:CCW67169.1 unnamed protein product [Phytomonas sp. isolate Hart1]
MHSRIVLSARPHRRWYLPGNILRCEARLEHETPRSSVQQPAALRQTGDQYRLFPIQNDSLLDFTGDTEWMLDSLKVSVKGYCALDPEWFSAEGLHSNTDAPPHSSINASPSSVQNPNDAPPHPSILWRVLSMVNGGSTDAMKSSLSLQYPLFESPVWTIAQSIPLNPGKHLSFSFSMSLPDELPPSVSGIHAKIAYLISIIANYHSESPNNHQTNSTTTVEIPIHVFSIAASISPIFIKSIFPLSKNHPLVMNNYSFSFCLSISTPSSCNTTTEGLNSHQRLESPPSSKEVLYWYNMKSDNEALTAKPRSLSKFNFTPPNRDHAPVQLILHSSKVAIGSSLIGVFNHNGLERENTSLTEEFTLVPLSACVSLESLECGNEYRIRRGKRFKKAYGLDNLAIIGSHTVCEERLILFDSPSTPFTFHLTTENISSASFFTDIVSIMWHIRVRVLWGIHNGIDTIKAENSEVVEAVIPIILEPPPLPQEHCSKLAV